MQLLRICRISKVNQCTVSLTSTYVAIFDFHFPYETRLPWVCICTNEHKYLQKYYVKYILDTFTFYIFCINISSLIISANRRVCFDWFYTALMPYVMQHLSWHFRRLIIQILICIWKTAVYFVRISKYL